ncbi:hypothetical protein H5410_021308 [Solanum commersonii]|uniref:Uncharacterized protein n=1 Tax=Solanum commersonii TaxID=4109 RepID=A0A9J5ZAL6_SOLCO|nr:hypothetical protein H5410_021308 [Solanum commersonii]
MGAGFLCQPYGDRHGIKVYHYMGQGFRLWGASNQRGRNFMLKPDCGGKDMDIDSVQPYFPKVGTLATFRCCKLR